MGDDAEYYMEQQEAEARHAQEYQQAQLDINKKYLYCWIDGRDQDIWWEWEPMSRVPSIFSKLYNSNKIGNEYFLASELPEQEYEEEEEDELDENYPESEKPRDTHHIRIIDGLEYLTVSNESEASSEVLIFTQKDLTPLTAEAARQKESANNLKDKIISEMLEYIASFIESNPSCDKFVFAREL